MNVPATLKKRLEVLENSLDLQGNKAIKVFVYHPEVEVPFWDPEPPEAWQQAHPKGQAVILKFQDCGVKR